MEFDSDSIAKIVGPLLSLLLSALIRHYTEAKVKLVSFIGHVSSFTLQDQQRTVVHTHSLIVRNAGRKTAHNVRLTHSFLPENIAVYPPVHYTIERSPEGSGEILMPVLVPKEQVTVSYLYFPPLTWTQINSSTKSDEGFAKTLNVIPVPQPSKSVLVLIWSLMFIGASFIFYWLTRLIVSAL